MPTADQFREELNSMFYEAFKRNQSAVDINPGTLHRRVGDYPGPNHRISICCEVMRSAMDEAAGDLVITEPPSGRGASLTIRYVLPRHEQTK